jgi:hypothetical protein
MASELERLQNSYFSHEREGFSALYDLDGDYLTEDKRLSLLYKAAYNFGQATAYARVLEGIYPGQYDERISSETTELNALKALGKVTAAMGCKA